MTWSPVRRTHVVLAVLAASAHSVVAMPASGPRPLPTGWTSPALPNGSGEVASDGEAASFPLELVLASPPDDNCSAATVIPAAPQTDFQSTAGATTEGTDPTPPCGNGSEAKTVWYRFTAPASGGALTVDTFGSDYDTILSAWSGVCGQFTAWPGGCNDDFGTSQSQISVPVPGGQTLYLMVSAYFGDGGSLVLHIYFNPNSGDVSGLRVGKAAGGDLTLAWNPSCQGSDTDYEVYRGVIGSWTSHTPSICSTGGATTTTVTPPASAQSYYLVVARNATYEGSYGRDRAGVERPPSVAPCLTRALGGCPPQCAHGKCATGAALDAACDACAAQVCAVDPFCCQLAWDSTCVSEVRTVCRSLICAGSWGTCAHGLCETGGALRAECDNPPLTPSCVTAICSADGFCCSNLWDSTCVSVIGTVCGMNCD